jgi:hypothetical protein
MKHKFTFLIIMVSSLLISCGIAKNALESSNLENSNKINYGMTKEEVNQLMGTDSHGGLNNPYKKEIFQDSKNRSIEVFYYMTNRFANTEEESLFPVILFEGKVIGTGWRAIESTSKKYDMQIRNR